ncbi:uncharacterized protein N7483_010199 [Penicillium malachiteum]|uniref:uncharacterized protein n=1 Tax=Penicillium malachiteum TaxID=1324776 RepID=UPI002546E6C5|nr:uncharacterized protein N7483_010199 [Penicillium malachiteum]KAJ5713018.1 hypothetical protein N7483_010199 [Penicillium malachiteum]
MFAVASDTFSNQDHTSCDDINFSHSFLPKDYPDLCLQCAYNWSNQILQPSPKLWFYKQHNPLEGLEAQYPIFDFQARMVANMSSNASYSDHVPADDSLKNDPEECLRRHRLSLFPDPVSASYDYQFQNDRCSDAMSLTSDNPEPAPDPDSPSFDPIKFADHLKQTDALTYTDNYPSDPDVSDSRSEDLVMPEWRLLVSSYFLLVRPVDVLFDNSSALTDSSPQFDTNHLDDSISSQSTAVESKRIDLVGELPSHEEVVAELAQALRVDANPKYQDASNTLPSWQQTFHSSDSRNSLWLADMSSASSPDFSDRNTNEWLSENDFVLTSPTASTHRLGSMSENLMPFPDPFSSYRSLDTFFEDTDDEDDGCLL